MREMPPCYDGRIVERFDRISKETRKASDGGCAIPSDVV